MTPAEMGTGVVGLANGLGQTWVWARKVLSNKWKEALKSHEEYRRLVEQNVAFYKDSMNSRCIDCKTLFTAALKRLEGKLKQSRFIVQKWNEKNSMVKRLTSENFIKKLERSENTIDHHLRLLPDCRCQATQHTNRAAKCATQHTDRAAKLIYIENLNVIDSNVNLNLIDCSAIQPYNGHRSQMEKENQNGLLMEKENQNGSLMEKENQNGSLMKNENRSRRESRKIHRPTTTEKVEKSNNRKAQKGKEFDKPERFHMVPNKRGKEKENQNGLLMEKENQNGSLMKNENRSRMESGKIHGPTTKEKVEKSNNRKPQQGKEFDKPERFHMVPNKREKQNGPAMLGRF